MNDERPAWLERELAKQQIRKAAPNLTYRQATVALLVREGMSRRQIADRLGIALATVDVHLREIARRIDGHEGLPAMRKIRRMLT